MCNKWISGAVLGMAVLLASCGTTSEDKKEIMQTEQAPAKEISKEENVLSETKTPQDLREKISRSETKSEEEFFERCLSLGSYENSVAINGEKRDEENMTIQNKHSIFPQCSIRAVLGCNPQTTWQYADVTEEDARKIVKLTEELKIEGYEKYGEMEEDDFPLYASLKIIVLNSKGEFKDIDITGLSYDKVEVRFRNKDDEQTYVLSPSRDLTQLIKKYTNYRLVSQKDIEKITELQVTKPEGENYNLTKAEVEKVKQLLPQMKRVIEPSDLFGYTISIVAKTSDGQDFSMRLYERKKEMLLECANYNVSEELIKLLTKEK